MAMLLQRCLPHCASLPISISSRNSPPSQRLATVKMVPKSLRLSICRASSEVGSAGVIPEKESTVFKDESQGIICYSDQNGDITCEGWDEGPHFQPDPQQPTLRRRRRIIPSEAMRKAMQARGPGETVVFKNNKGQMGDSVGEVANESTTCSDL